MSDSEIEDHRPNTAPDTLLPHPTVVPVPTAAFHHHQSPISNVPADVLLLIFREIKESTLREWEKGVPFPDSVASVCTQWRDVVSSVSAFWSFILIAVDENRPTPLTVVSRHLSHSRNQLLDIQIRQLCLPWHPRLYRSSEQPENREDPGERDRVAAVMNLIMPHQGRLHDLYFNILHRTSMPRPYMDFHGIFPRLENLTMIYNLEDGQDDRLALPMCPLNAPILGFLDVAGPVLRQFHESSTTWPFPDLGILLVGPYPEYPPWPVADFAACLRDITELEILEMEDLELADSEPDGAESLDVLQLLSIERMRGDVLGNLNALLGFPITDQVTYDSCSIPTHVRLFDNMTRRCRFTHMDSLDVLNVLLNKNYKLETLEIKESAFTEEIIDALAEPSDDGRWMCPNMTSITLSGYCFGFSEDKQAQTAFVNMIRMRYTTHHVYTESTRLGHEAKLGVVPLTHIRIDISVLDDDIEAIDKDDLEWLDAHIYSVEWGGWSGGTGRRSESADDGAE